jgi:hypothetical protein
MSPFCKILGVVISASIFQAHAVQARSLSEFTKKLDQIQNESQQLSEQNCEQDLQDLTLFFKDYIPEAADKSILNAQGQQVLDNSFKARVILHDQLGHLPLVCAEEMKNLFRNMRAAEDNIGVVTYADQQINTEDVQFARQPVPLLQADAYHPFHLNNQPFGFKKGDLMITKGVTIVSSTISAMAQDPSLFSHIVFVYQDPKTQEFGTIESYIGKGVDRYAIDFALRNENARILQLRAKDQSLAVAAHDYMVDRVLRSEASPATHIHYDYKQDLSDDTAMTCEEIAYDAFKVASHNQFILPWMPSEVGLKDPKFLKNAGLQPGLNMLPADMEVDPRFDIVLDWTDYRIMRDSSRKDAIMQEVVRWINEEGYVMHNSAKATAAKLIWDTREIGFLWPKLSKLAGIPEDYETEVPANGLALVANLKVLGAYLIPVLAKADQVQFAKTGQWMSNSQMRSYVNSLRVQDMDRFRSTGMGKFHGFFRPDNLKSFDH